MGALWNIYFILLFSFPLSLNAAALTEENIKETQATDDDQVKQFLTPPQEKFGQTSLAQDSFMFGPEDVDFLSQPLNWPLSSSENLDRQDVIGEYSDIQEGTDTTVYPNEGRLTFDILTEGTTLVESVKTSKSSLRKVLQNPTKKTNPLSTERSRVSTEHPPLQYEISDIHFPLPFSDSLSSPIPDLNPTSSPLFGQKNNPDQQNPSTATNTVGWTKDIPISIHEKHNGTNLIADTILIREAVNTDETSGKSHVLSLQERNVGIMQFIPVIFGLSY